MEAVAGDVTEAGHRAALVATARGLGGLDLLVNNASALGAEPLVRLDELALDGLLTGLHEPQASHLLMLEAVAGRAAVDRGYTEAVRRLYLWHEFGDTHLLLPEEFAHAGNCDGNCR